MASRSQSADPLSRWSVEALAMAAQAKVLSGNKLEQLVVRIQRHSGQPKEACWRLIIQYGIKDKADYRRWTEPEFEIVREELVFGSETILDVGLEQSQVRDTALHEVRVVMLVKIRQRLRRAPRPEVGSCLVDREGVATGPSDDALRLSIYSKDSCIGQFNR